MIWIICHGQKTFYHDIAPSAIQLSSLLYQIQNLGYLRVFGILFIKSATSKHNSSAEPFCPS